MSIDAKHRDAFLRAWGLRPQEANLLALLWQANGRVLRYAFLADALPKYHERETPDPAYVKVLLCLLRGKMKNRDHIRTLWGAGLALTESGREACQEAIDAYVSL